MNSENNYYNYYVETLTSTMTDAIIRNVSLQASVKVGEETIKEYERVVELMDAEIGTLKQQLEHEKAERNKSENSKIRDLENMVSDLSTQLSVLKSEKKDFEENKHQLQHLDTFRKEIIVCRKENEQLKGEIEYLKLSPSKRKKLDEQNKMPQTNKINTEELIKDGGSF